MTTAIVHLMQGDVDGLVDDAISLGFLPVCVERTGVVVVSVVCVRACACARVRVGVCVELH